MICLGENEYLFKNQAGKKYKTIYADPPWITERDVGNLQSGTLVIVRVEEARSG